MKGDLLIVDAKEGIVGDEVWKSTDDCSLFHLTPKRTMNQRGLFDDCTFVELFIDHKTDWGAPIPSTFQNFFREILGLIIPGGYILVLNIVDLYEGYFNQDQFVESFVKPNGYINFYVTKEMSGKVVTTLFFECPIHRVSILDDVAFPGTVIDVDGFVLDRSKVGLFPLWEKMGNTDTMFRDLLRNVFFAFSLWRDHNGMFIASDKLDIAQVKKTLLDSSLQQEIYDYIGSLP